MRAALAVQAWRGEADDLGVDAASSAAIAVEAWREVNPAVEVSATPVGDGSPRTADLLPGTRDTLAGASIVEGPGGLWLAPADGAFRWNPQNLGRTLLELADAGERRTVCIPLGDEAPGGDAVDLWLDGPGEMREALRTLAVVALVGSRRPLLGFQGMSSAVRDGREHDAAVALAAQEQERRWAEIARRADPIAGVSLMGEELSDSAGAGAAGGLAYCLAVVGARLAPGAATVVEMWGPAASCEGVSVVGTVSDPLTPRVLDHGVAQAMAAAAGRHAVPAFAIAPGVHVGKRDLMAAGLSTVHEGAEGADGLHDAVRRVAQTWTPRR